jgi:hypothetical protein
MRQVRVETPEPETIPVVAPVVERSGNAPRTKLAPGVIPQTILAIFPEGECTRATLLVLTREQLPALHYHSFDQALTRLQADGLVYKLRWNAYCLVERKPHLSVVDA